MKHLRKRLLSLVALFAMTTGAWAQGPTQVTQFTTDMLPASWQDDYDHDVTLADLQALGFEAVDENTAAAWTGAPQNDYAWLIYGFNEGNGSFNNIMFDNGNAGNMSYSSYTKGYLYGLVANGSKLFYTSAPPAIELTPDATGKVWTLAETPDYDLELQVEYYQKYALKDIPEGWTVLVNGVEQQQPYLGDSLMITETDSVELVPPADVKPNVKSVTLTAVVPATPQTLIVPKGTTGLSGDKELYYITGDTYRQALARPENQSGNGLGWGVWEDPTLTTIFFKEVSDPAWDMTIDGQYNFAPGVGAITLDSVIDPNHTFLFTASH